MIPQPKKSSANRTNHMKRPLVGHRRGRWGASATGAFSTAKPKGFIDSAIHNRSAIPGSSKYRPKRVRVNQGRKFSTSFPKNDVDWAIYAARKKPGPGQYPTTKFKVNRFTDGHSGKFNQSNPANDVDIMMRRSRREPGPLEYTTSFDKVSKRLGGQQGRAFSTSVLPTFSDIQKNYTVDNPGPGHYKGDRVERNRKSSTGQISKAHVPGFVEIALRHRGSNPSPLHYQHNNYDKAIRESYGSSKMSSSFPKSDVDWKVYRASFIPGPGQYNVPHAFRSDVLHSSGANISHSISVPAVLQVPVRQTQTMSCYDGTLKVPTEIVKLFQQCGVIRTIRSFMKRQIEKIVKLIDGYPLSQDMLTDRNKSKKHLENVLQRMQQKYGSSRPTSIAPLVKLVATMLQMDGQMHRAIEIMKSTVNAK